MSGANAFFVMENKMYYWSGKVMLQYGRQNYNHRVILALRTQRSYQSVDTNIAFRIRTEWPRIVQTIDSV